MSLEDYFDCQPDIRVLSHRIVTSRKRHECDRCFDAIEPGMKYERSAIVEDGKFEAFKTHTDCVHPMRKPMRKPMSDSESSHGRGA